MSALNTTSGKLFVMVALWSAYPSVGWAQENGYLVLAGIEDGPARVFVDGTELGSLLTAELTLELAPGMHTVEVFADGRPRFERSVVVLSGDVSHLPVVLSTSTDEIHVVHLDPARVDVRIQGHVVALTPATVTVPAGDTTIQLGNWAFCFDLLEDADAYVRVRNGRVDELE